MCGRRYLLTSTHGWMIRTGTGSKYKRGLWPSGQLRLAAAIIIISILIGITTTIVAVVAAAAAAAAIVNIVIEKGGTTGSERRSSRGYKIVIRSIIRRRRRRNTRMQIRMGAAVVAQLPKIKRQKRVGILYWTTTTTIIVGTSIDQIGSGGNDPVRGRQ